LVIFLTSAPLATALIAYVAILALIMGLTPQEPIPYRPNEITGPISRLGLDRLTGAWPLASVYLLLLVSLGAAVAVKFARRGAIFLFLHLGLWLLLAAAGPGAADRSEEIMIVPVGSFEWRAQRPNGEILEMPLAIRLDDFDLEEYPAQLAIIEHGPVSETFNPKLELWQIDPLEPSARLGGFDIELLEFLPNANPVADGIFVRAIMKGLVQAAKVRVVNRQTREIFEGWVSTGNKYQPPRPLSLSGNLMLTMTKPAPRRFISKVKVFARENLEEEGIIEVNKPMKIGSWYVYQRNYDSSAGRSSSWSGFELVKDPWLPMAWAGVFLMSLGSIGLVIRGRVR
jgi:hypothetical protein